MNTFANESGGMHFPMTFEGEVPGYLNSINALLRSQYSLSYDLDRPHEPGKKYKLVVKVDVDGDGQYDDKAYVVQHKPFYTTPGETQRKTAKRNREKQSPTSDCRARNRNVSQPFLFAATLTGLQKF